MGALIFRERMIEPLRGSMRVFLESQYEGDVVKPSVRMVVLTGAHRAKCGRSSLLEDARQKAAGKR